MIPAWVGEFVGIPWQVKGRTRDGCDCWGCVRLAMGEHYHITLPSYVEAYDDLGDRPHLATLFHDGIPAGGWRRVDVPREGDGVVLRVIGPRELHVGLVVAPGLFLHAWEPYGGTAVDRLDHPLWAKRVLGFYRHPERA